MEGKYLFVIFNFNFVRIALSIGVIKEKKER